MGWFQPTPVPYDPIDWSTRPFPEKARMVCLAWARDGYGTPHAIYLIYALKLAGFVGAWVFFCSRSPGLGGVGDIGQWWLEPLAFQKALLWSALFEVLGFGCGSGPLTGRYLPPVGGFLYFLRPGTTKLPIFHGAPLIGSNRRTIIDAALYAALVVSLVIALLSPALDSRLLVTIVVLIPVLGVLDRTIFLAARSEHYWVMIVCFAVATDWIGAAKAVQCALWFWAGFSKLNHHFPSVVAVMTSNGPLTRFPFLRRAMYVSFPDDLRPSRLATVMGHIGTSLEFAVPVILVASSGGTATMVGLILMVVLHSYITSNVPMAAPIEWNVVVVYGGFFLFGAHADVATLAVDSLPLAAFVAVFAIALPLLGNIAPKWISFLLSMRYYAGNWAYSVWLFRGDSHEKLERLTKSSPWVYDQLNRIYDHPTAVGVIGKVIGFRLMHVHGRALHDLIPRAVDRFADYQWIDGEIVAGLALGWNFGDGHLHDEQLLAAIQQQCDFDDGELRCIFVESQPFARRTLGYRIRDARSGLIASGEVDVRVLMERKPWPAAGDE